MMVTKHGVWVNTNICNTLDGDYRPCRDIKNSGDGLAHLYMRVPAGTQMTVMVLEEPAATAAQHRTTTTRLKNLIKPLRRHFLLCTF